MISTEGNDELLEYGCQFFPENMQMRYNFSTKNLWMVFASSVPSGMGSFLAPRIKSVKNSIN